MKTLEQIIMDASEEWCRRDNVDWPVIQNEAAAIAEAVRGWMREQNQNLRGVIGDLLLEELPPQSVSLADVDSCTEAILSVIPPLHEDTSTILKLEEQLRVKAMEYDKLMETGTVHPPKPGDAEGDNLDAMLKLHLANQRSLTNEEHQHLTQFLRSIREESAKGPADQSNHADLVKTEPLYGWANKRIEMLEAENKRIKELEAEVARFKDVTQEGASLETLRTQRDKAAKYDSVCEQFPYMPGAVVWILQDGVIQRATVWRIGERVARVLLDEIAIDVDPSRLHYTADACRAAIPVEE